MLNVFKSLKSLENAKDIMDLIFGETYYWNLEILKKQAIEILDDNKADPSIKSYANMFAERYKKLIDETVKSVPSIREERAKLIRNGREIKY